MASKSFGVKVTVGAAVVGELIDVSIGGVDVNMIDVTSHDSDGWKEFLGGLKDGGNVELSGNFIEADPGQAEIRDNAGATSTVEVELSEGTTITAAVIIGPYNLGTPLDDKIGFTATLKVTGPLTYTGA